MKQLLAALEQFGQNPEAIGDDLFNLFGVIMQMTWEDACAAGSAVRAMQDEAWRAAKAREVESKQTLKALDDPTYNRLRSLMGPIGTRIGQLIAEAPKDRQAMLIDAVTFRHGTGIITFSTTEVWKKTLGIT